MKKLKPSEERQPGLNLYSDEDGGGLHLYSHQDGEDFTCMVIKREGLHLSSDQDGEEFSCTVIKGPCSKEQSTKGTDG